MPDSSCNSYKLPATVASRLGSEGPKLCSGNEMTIRPRRYSIRPVFEPGVFERGALLPGKLGVATISSASMRTTCAPKRSFSSLVSPGTDTKVPLDCSPAITAAACSSGCGVSIR